MYITFTVGENEYKLRLGAAAMIALEKKIGGSPLKIFMEMEAEGLPRLEDLLVILHASLQQYNKGMTEKKVYELFDEYVDNGGSVIELVPVILEVLEVSGIVPKGTKDSVPNAPKA